MSLDALTLPPLYEHMQIRNKAQEEDSRGAQTYHGFGLQQECSEVKVLIGRGRAHFRHQIIQRIRRGIHQPWI